jgi:hypothetical protein
MESILYNLVSALADNYGFDADEALEFVRWETDVDHVGEVLKMMNKPTKAAPAKKAEPVEKPAAGGAGEKPVEEAKDETAEKIATCQKNIALWQKKLDEGAVKDEDKQREKIEKEQKKLEKLLAKPEAKPEPKKEKETKPEPKKEKETKPEVKPEVKPEPKKEKEAVKEKRIKRFSPVMATQLKSALESVKVEITDKLKKEFQQYVEDLTDDDFRKEGLADHMRTFSKMKAPVETVVEETPAESEEEAEKEELASGGARLPAKEEEEKPEAVSVTLKELQSISTVAGVEPMGTFWDGDNGKFVKGPDGDDDEDFEDVTFEGKDYVVGEKTGRVYEARESGDVFAGFIGVAKFKKMTR